MLRATVSTMNGELTASTERSAMTTDDVNCFGPEVVIFGFSRGECDLHYEDLSIQGTLEEVREFLISTLAALNDA